MQSFTITAPLQQDKDGTWWFVHIPRDIRQALKAHEKRGLIPVTAVIGGSTWEGSLLPWADGSAQLSIKRPVREKEGLALASQVRVTISPR